MLHLRNPKKSPARTAKVEGWLKWHQWWPSDSLSSSRRLVRQETETEPPLQKLPCQLSRRSRKRAPITMAFCHPATHGFRLFGIQSSIRACARASSISHVSGCITVAGMIGSCFASEPGSRTSHGCQLSLCARCDDCNSLAAIGGTKAQGIIATGGLSNLRDTEKEQFSGRQPRLTATPRIMRSLTSPTVCPVLECPSLPPTIYSLQ